MRSIKQIVRMAITMLLAIAIGTSGAAVYAADSDSALNMTVATPRANYASGVYTQNMYVTLSCTTSGARIFYTTDGSHPSIYSKEYTSPIRIKGVKGESTTTILRAIAVKTGYETSEEAEYAYKIEIPLDPDVEYMEIQKTPNKTRYKKGDELNLTGGKIIVSYEDGTYASIEMTESMISGFNTNTAGEKEITVSYAGFTDHFTITVTGSNSSSYDDDDYYYDPEEEDLRPQLSGTTIRGWSNIEQTLSDKATGSSYLILLNEAVAVPSDLLRTAAKNELELTFKVNDEMKWKLDTALMDTETVPSIGLGIRTNAISLPDNPIKEMGGTEVKRFHINSNNKLNAVLNVQLGAQYYRTIASLFRYNSTDNTLELVDTRRTNITGDVSFTPDKSGDYIVIVDEETKIIGDLNNDLRVDVADAALLLQLVINGAEEDRKNDYDRNGALNALDVSAMLKYIVG